jgi:hypothetical protein
LCSWKLWEEGERLECLMVMWVDMLWCDLTTHWTWSMQHYWTWYNRSMLLPCRHFWQSLLTSMKSIHQEKYLTIFFLNGTILTIRNVTNK